MTRRSYLTLMATPLAAAPCKQASPAPTDPAKINAYVNQFNAYLLILQDRDIVDLKQWERVERARLRMTDV